MRSDKATMVVTVVTTAVGTVLVVMGIALLVLPGPGLLLIAAGLALLARNFTWAEHLLHRARTTIDHRRGRRDESAGDGASIAPGSPPAAPVHERGDDDGAAGGDGSAFTAA